MKTKIILSSLLLLAFSFFTNVNACDQSGSTLTSCAQNANGTYTLTFEVCFAGSNNSQGDSHGFYITVTSANVLSVAPTSITNNTTVSSLISGDTIAWGSWNDNTSPCFVCISDARVCYNINVTTDVLPSEWAVGGQEYQPETFPFNESFCKYTGSVILSTGTPNSHKKTETRLLNTYNFMGLCVDDNYKGYVIEVYDDGSTVKKYRD